MLRSALFALLLSTPFIAAEAQAPAHSETLQILSRESYNPRSFQLDDASWRWLGEKRTLTVGVWQPEVPPLDMFTQDGHYEGISADYIILLAQYLGLRVKVQEFTSRDAALDALSENSIDLVVDPTGITPPQHSNLVPTRNFISDHPVLVFPQGKSSTTFKYKPGMRLAISRWYVDDGWLSKVFPGARISHFDDDDSALSSVAFGENDFYIGSLVTASYLVDNNYSSMLVMQEVYPERDTGSRFLICKNQPVLLNAINKALDAIPNTQNQVIQQKWSSGGEMLRLRHGLTMNDREQRWLQQHTNVPVAIGSLYPPLSMLGEHGNFYGVAADILRLIRLRTGINFVPVRSDTVTEAAQQVLQGKADFIGAIDYSPEREAQFNFSRPWFRTPFVLVTTASASSPLDLRHPLRLAVVRQNRLMTTLHQDYPHLSLIPVDNASVAMQMVADGKVDGAVNTLLGANYLIDRFFSGKLRINQRIGDEPADIAFAVRRDQPELLSLLNKALADIPASDIASIVGKWQSRPDVPLSTWQVYRTQFWLLTGVAAIIALTSLVWIYYLRRQVAARRLAQNQLQLQLQFSDTLLNGVPVPVYVVDARGEQLRQNQAWQNFFSSEIAPQMAQPISASDHPLHTIWQLNRPLLSGNAIHASLSQPLTLCDGQRERNLIHYAVPWLDEQQQIAGLICTWVDVTDHQQLTQELLEASERADQANRAKSTFLATMSHEIRTPVSAIIGLLELAVNTPGRKDEEMEPVRVAWESARSLMGLIGDILDMARIESGRLELAPEWVRSSELVPPILRVFEGLARQKNLRLTSSMPPLLPHEIFIDPLRFRQVLSNLVSNAIKFTEHGSVEVDVAVREADAQQIWLTLSVSDSGRGISHEEQATLFRPWSQAQAGRQQSGSGLGLAICSQLVSMMGGSIGMTSELGEGTRVSFSVPVAHRAQQPIPLAVQPEAPAETLPPLRILAVDDHPANRMLLRRQLGHLGHSVTEACDGEEAWELWQSQPFDLVITDCSMPGMDGLALTQLIRQHQHQPVVVLGLTANAWPEERTRCQQAGMDDCLFKPLQLPQLQAILANTTRMLREQNAELPVSPSAAADDPDQLLAALVCLEGLRTLTQHDDDLMRELLATTLETNERDLLEADDLLKLEDWPELARCVHRLSGAVQIISAENAEQRCRQLETSCRLPQPDPAVIAAEWQQARSALMQLHQAIQRWLRVG